MSEKPGLGIEPDVRAIKKYLVEVEIKVAGKMKGYEVARNRVGAANFFARPHRPATLPAA